MGCPKRVDSPTSILEEAASRADSANANARTRALAAFHDWLYANEPERAQKRLDLALEFDPKVPWARFGAHALARRSARLDASIEHAIALVIAAPDHPLAAVAARRLVDAAGTSPAMDARLLTGIDKALANIKQGDVAHLLRLARVRVLEASPDAAAREKARTALGTMDRWTLVGPFSAWNILEFGTPTAPERDGNLSGPFTTPFGAARPRALHFPGRTISLSNEGAPGGLFVLAADVEVPKDGEYVLRTAGASSHRVLIDGTPVLERARWTRAMSNLAAAVVRLSEGRHRVMLVLARDELGSGLDVYLTPANADASGIRIAPAEGAPAVWAKDAVELPEGRLEALGIRTGAEDTFRALTREVGPALAAFVAISDGMARDPDGARRLAEELFNFKKEQGQPLSGALLALRAELWAADGELGVRVARGRSTRDLEAALERDPRHVSALLQRARIALDDGRQGEAAELVQRARAAAGGEVPPHEISLLRARLDLALGLDAQAEVHAQEAVKATPGLCEAGALLYDLARRRDAVAEADERVKALQPCPQGLSRAAEHARWRGRISEATRLQEALWGRERSLGRLSVLLSLYTSAARWDDALAKLGEARRDWPRNPEWLVRAADLHELAGRREEALRAREAALTLSGGDLSLRRRVHRARTGKELLEEHAVDGAQAIARYQEQPGTGDAQSALVLDAAVVEAFADGSRVDRIHIIQRALTQDGVQQIGEVHLPPGAQVLQLRTVKADGTVLEPEDIEGKDTISMPAVEVGDFVQYEYLEGHGPRGPAQPGFTAPAFYFQLAGVPNVWSTYVVVSPKEVPLVVDAHNMKAAPPKLEGGKNVFRHEDRHVPPFIPEPSSPPSGNEYLPWLQAGSGAQGNEGLITTYADAVLSAARRTFEVESFARRAVGERKGEDAVRALHAAVMGHVQGDEAGLSATAAATIARGRGSRLWALKATLEAVGIPARVAAIRTVHVDPQPYRFPNEALFPYVALRVELPEGRHVWLDPAVRFGPYGRLPEQAAGQEALLFPEPGRPLEKTVTPPAETTDGKLVKLELELLPDGTLQGGGTEQYVGFEGAQLSQGLEALPPDRRQQALQSALARYFGGAELSSLELELADAVGKPLVVRYRFRAPGFARAEGQRLVLGALTYPANLGRRYVQLGKRETPLFIEGTERSATQIRLTLPEGRTLDGPLGELRVDSPFGAYVRKERQEGRVLMVEEDLRVGMGRVPPNRYEELAHFAGQVDLVQSRDLLVR